MDARDLAQYVTRAFCADSRAEKLAVTPLERLLVLRYLHPTTLEATFYEAVLCLILRGRKETMVGERRVSFGPGESLIVSHGLPVVSRVTEASADEPYLALILTLDLGILRGLHARIGDVEADPAPAESLATAETGEALLDALSRYVRLASRPVEIPVMTPLLLEELHLRLLLAPHGAMLRQLVSRGSHADNIARAIERIRTRFRVPLLVPELARTVGMSPSSFHKHFKAVTATTPLQYQKDLRLLEARRLLIEGAHSVSAAAYEVGYESPTQFSREYARKFGAPPRRDLAAAP